MLLSIPVKPYVKHLIIKHYGKEPIAVRANSEIGSFFLLALVKKAYLAATFNWLGDVPPSTDVEVILEEKNEDSVFLKMPENCVELRFEVGGKFKDGVFLPDMLVHIGRSLEGYCRIYMKGFSHGYRSLFNSSRNSALVFHNLYEYEEEVLTRDNCEKIIQRENAEMTKDPIEILGLVRKSFRFK
ncbi:MAG: hypothetical protein ACRDBG_23895 [Waterburya sp.]